MPNITKRFVDALRPRDQPFAVYDDRLKGFGIRVMPSGLASYILEYRPDGGGRGVSTKRMVLSRVGEMTTEQARNLAKDRLIEVRRGGDPLAERRAKREEPTLGAVIDRWEIENPVGRRGKALSVATRILMLGRLRAHVVPLLGARKISSITTADLNEMVQRVVRGDTRRDGKSAKKRGRFRVRGGEAAARRSAADLAAIYNYAIDRGITKTNPTIGIRKPAARQRRDYLRLHEIEKMAVALDGLAASGTNPSAIAILQLLMLTGCRPGEIEGLKWTEVDFESKCLRLANTKTGYSVRPLSIPAMQILDRRTRLDGSPYVFPAARGDGYYSGSKRIWAKARDAAGLTGKVRYHARHAVATLSLAGGTDIVSVANMLGHADPRTTLTTYSHVTDKVVEASEKIGGIVSAAMRRRVA